MTPPNLPADLCVAMVTEPSKPADSILGALSERGLPVAAVILDRGKMTVGAKLKRTRQVWRRSGPTDVARRVRRRLHRSLTNRDRTDAAKARYTDLANAVVTVEDANSPESGQLIGDLAPDLIVLGTSRILRSHIIQIPQLGVLNVHPGLLPEYRGVDVIAWALRNDDPLGVTVHWVDAGIDTGPIAAQQRLEIEHGDTLSSLRQRAAELSGQLMADVVSGIAAGRPAQAVEQHRKSGKLYTRMPPAELRKVEQKLADRWSKHAATG